MNIVLAVILIAVAAVLAYSFGRGHLAKVTKATNQTIKEKQSTVEKKLAQLLSQAESSAEDKIQEAKSKAQRMLSNARKEGESIKKKRIYEAKLHSKELLLKKKATFEADADKKRNQQRAIDLEQKEREKALNSRDLALKQQKAEVENIRQNLKKQLESLIAKREKYQKNLERMAKFTMREAKEELLESIKDEAEAEALAYVRDALAEAKLTANREARKIVIQSIQRMAAEHTIENTVSVFYLESDDLKGQIIGREGRNIRTLEATTGTDIIVDDTPQAVVISSFDPVRREICRLALEYLVADGRIHPARIEEVVAKTEKQLNQQIIEIGQRTVIDLDIHGVQAPLIRMIGRMRFRSSYGQNLLKHSIETAKLCATMSAELSLSKPEIHLAKRAGLLHDIGKVAEDEENELSHALLGMKMCEEFGEKPAVVNAVGAHHNEIEMDYLISPIVQACDAISGARPGARRGIMESYVQRIRDLENLAMQYDGVKKVYAMQAGRELRVIVASNQVSDTQAEELSFTIAQQIQREVKYPGRIKVIVIREKRSTSFAR